MEWLKSSIPGHLFNRLPHTQVTKYVLRTGKNGIKARGSVVLNGNTHNISAVKNRCQKCGMLTFSTNLPMPVVVMDLPPNTCVASSAVSRPAFDTNLINRRKGQQIGLIHWRRND
jgi:hypothetical protein